MKQGETFYLFLICISGISGLPWYQGCFHGNGTTTTSDVLVLPRNDSLPVSPSDCSRQCLVAGYTYTVVKGSSCDCTRDITGYLQTTEDRCNNSCLLGTVSSVCNSNSSLGGASEEFVSVFTTEGPFISHVEVLVLSSPVYVGHVVPLEVRVQLGGLPETGEGFLGLNGSDFGELFFVWSLDGVQFRQDNISALENETFVLPIIHTFSQPGWTWLDIQVTNLVSTGSSFLNQSVVVPRPTDLQLFLSDSVHQLPSCIPQSINATQRLVAVFKDVPVTMQGSVALGTNLTFAWDFGDGGGVEVVTPYLNSAPCVGKECTAVNKSHTFTQLGIYDVKLEVNNSLGSLQAGLRVVVLDRGLANLTLERHDSSPNVTKPGVASKFVVSMATASREVSYLRVDFGDGDVLTYALIDSNDTLLVREGQDRLLLLSSYGEGCTLHVEVDHTYTDEGIFTVSIQAFNNYTTLNQTLTKAVQVVRELKDLRLNAKRAAKLNEVVVMTLTLASKSDSAIYSWGFLHRESQTWFNTTTNTTTLSHTFTTVGTYTIAIEASNEVSRISMEGMIKIQIPIGNVSIISQSPSPAATWETVSVSALLHSGSDPIFTWSFGDYYPSIVRSENMTSTADHVYRRPGEYIAIVSVDNMVSRSSNHVRFTILESVSTLLLTTTGPLELRNNVTVTASVEGGTDVQFEVDDGQGFVEVSRSRTNPKSASSVHSFSAVGTFPVTYVAYNNISRVTKTTEIIVQEMVGNVTIATPGRVIVGEIATFYAQINGVLTSERPVLYHWTVEGATVVTRSPVWYTSLASVGTVTVTLKVSNLVSTSSAAKVVDVEPLGSEPYLVVSGPTAVGQQVQLAIKNVQSGATVNIDYGDNTTATLTTPNGQLTFSHTYAQTGEFWLNVALSEGANGGFYSLGGVAVIEEPITGLEIAGPSAVRQLSTLVGHVWTAGALSGTNLVYAWSFGTNQTEQTALSKVTKEFTKPGTYNLTLTATNGLGSAMSVTKVTAQHSIDSLGLSVKNTIPGYRTQFAITISGGREFWVTVDLGDGNVTQFSSENPGNGVDFKVLTPSSHHTVVPKYECVVHHAYSDIGDYSVSVNVSNYINSMAATKVLKVDTPITGVTISTTSPRYVAATQPVTFIATVATGNNLMFFWQTEPQTFVYPTKITETHNSSEVVYQFPQARDLNVSVRVTNAIYQFGAPSEIGGITVHLPFLISVNHPVSQVSIEPMTGIYAAADNATVSFDAKTHGGSNVMFHVDFGDGTTASGAAVFGLLGLRREFTHKYTAEGVYRVSVTATNPLNQVTANMSAPMYVMRPPGHVYIISPSPLNPYFKPGETIHFNGSITSGSNLTFDWSFGDQTELIDAGLSVSHTYLDVSDVGYLVRLTAKNRVKPVYAYLQIFVQHVIQGCDTVVEGGRIHEYNTPVTLRITPQPLAASAPQTFYEWDIQSQFSSWSSWDQTYLNFKSYRTLLPGSYTALTKANNRVSNLTDCTPVEFRVVERLSRISLQLQNQAIFGQTFEFNVYHFRGSDVRYTWDFGDGLHSNESNRHASHKYLREGHFIVKVVASNPLGNETTTLDVFVLRRFCLQPQVNVIPADLETVFSKPLRLEADINVQCDISNALWYRWEFRNASATNGTVVTYQGAHMRGLHQKVLCLPPRSVPPGNYSILLWVGINNTIVTTKAEARVVMAPTPIVSVIKGGVMRYFNTNDTVELDGTASYDPDNQTAILRYNWTCYLLTNTSKSCFRENVNLPSLDQPILQVTREHLLPMKADKVPLEYVFNLTVSNGGKANSTTTVVILTDIVRYSVSIQCKGCKNTVVNSDYRLSMEASCPDCPDDLEYEWEVNLVHDGRAATPAGAHDEGQCVKSDGSSYILYLRWANSTASSLNLSTTTAAPTSTSTPAPDNTGPSSTPLPNFNPFPGFGDMQEGSEDSDRHKRDVDDIDLHPASGPVRRRRQTEGMIMEGGSANFGNPSEGGEGGRGNGPGRGTGSGSGSPGVDVPTVPPATPPDGAFDGNKKDKENPHIVSYARTAIPIRPEQTVTGLHQQSLIISPHVLTQGRFHIIQVKVKDKDSRVVGETWADIWVNESPVYGKCDVRPSNGVELQTTFSAFCLQWVDQDTPLEYELSVSFDEDEPHHILYRGYKAEKIEFQLPAGREDRNHTVLIHLSILDRHGSRTTVCSEPVQVLPRNVSENSTLQKDLHDAILGEKGALVISQEEGDVMATNDNILLLASWLNRLSDDASIDVPLTQRQAYRQHLSEILLATRHSLVEESAILQTSAALAWVTAKASELNAPTLKAASQVLEAVTKATGRILNNSLPLAPDLLTLGTRSASHVLEGVSLRLAGGGLDDSDREDLRRVVTTVEEAVDDLLKVALNDRSIGEEPINEDTDFASHHAALYDSRSVPTLQVPGAKFVLPSTLPAVVAKQQAVFAANGCVQVVMVTYKGNPFIGQEVQSRVASLKLFDCLSNPIVVQNLTDESLIRMELQNTPDQNAVPQQYQLKKENMNIHKFNVTVENLRQSLQVELEFLNQAQGRSFPIALLISFDQPPSPTHHWLKKEYHHLDSSLKIYIPAGRLNQTGTYYLGVVDASFDAGRPRDGEIRERGYALRMWWGDCVYWNEQIPAWSSEGCYHEESSTYATTHCSCNHLTSFAGHFSPVSSDLTVVKVDTFFVESPNYVPPMFVGCVVIIYIMLLILCCRFDTGCERREVICLEDNSPTDKQRYEIMIETGSLKGAGTTAKVSIILHGMEGISETRELVCQGKKEMFKPNSRHTFLATLPEGLGKLWKVQLWHNNAGRSPSWYLSTVIVKDLNTGQKYYFICERWFAVEEDDGRIEREIPALEGKPGFQRVFWTKGWQYFCDYHIWSSIITRPAYSRFSRPERLTCCFTMLMAYMCLDCLWFHWKEPHLEYRGEFGLLDLSWKAIAVGAICSAIVGPLYVLLAFLYRRSELKKSKHSTEERYKSLVKNDDEQSERSSETPTVLPIMTHSLIDQSLIHWQSLQEWAQKTWEKRYQQSMSSSESVKPKKGYETEASSGFEDCLSQDRTAAVLSDTSDQDTRSDHSDNGAKVLAPTDVVLIEDHTRGPQNCLCPLCFRYIVWTLCLVIASGCGAITVMYGLNFGHVKSVMWLQSFYFSLMTSVFFTQPVVILLAVLITACKYRNEASILNVEDIEYCEDVKLVGAGNMALSFGCRNEDDELAKGIAARQRSRYLRFARPPQEKELIKARRRNMKEKKAYAILWDILSFALVFLLLIFMAFGKFSSTSYQLNKALETTFLSSFTHPLEKVKHLSDWWQWSKTDMLDSLYGTSSNQFLALPGNSYIIGYAILRQLRVNEVSCEASYNISKTCRHDYSGSSKQTSDFGQNVTFGYSSLQYSGIMGQHAWYDGNGFIVRLNKTRAGAYSQLTELQTAGWTSRQTRALILEFTTFHAPTSFFSSVKVICEFPPTGQATPSVQVISTHLYKYVTVYDNLHLACELLFIIVMLYRAQKVLSHAIRLGKQFFCHPWNMVEVALTLLFLAYFVCYVYRFVLVQGTVEILRSTYHEEFVDLTFVAFWDEVLRTLVGLMLFLVLTQFLRLLRYSRLYAKIGNVYKRARWDLLTFFLAFVIWVMAYSSTGVALFNTISYQFSSLWRGIFSVSALMTGSYDLKEPLDGPTSTLAAIFLISFMIFALGMLTAYVIAILTVHYRAYHQDEIIALSPAEWFGFFWEKILACTGVRDGDREEEEGEEMLPAEFTIAEIEYQVDELLFKMSSLAGDVLPDKYPAEFADQDRTFGFGDDGISSGSSEIHFNEERFEQRIQKIEENLYTHEPHLAQLIQLSNIGALRTMSNEEETRLRSELEMEIFRQLQMQRQESNMHSEGYSSGSHGNSFPTQEGALSGSTSPSDGIPHLNRATFPSPPQIGALHSPQHVDLDYGSSRSAHTDSPSSVRSQNTKLEQQGDYESEMTKEKKQRIDSSGSSSRYTGKGSCKASPSPEQGFSDTESKASSQAKSQSSQMSENSGEGARPKTYATGAKNRALLSAKEPGSGYACLDSSTDSDDDGKGKKLPKKQEARLRKTKSRGRGKGKQHIPSALELESFAFDNEAYSADSDLDDPALNDLDPQPGTSKQCWS